MKNDPQRQYKEARILSASQTELVKMMFEMLISDLHNAIDAIAHQQVERRTAELGHAINVLGELQNSLNLEAGGEFADSMNRLYSAVRAKLMEAQWKVSSAILLEQLDAIETVNAAWKDLPTDPTASLGAETMPPPDSSSASMSAEWRA